MERNVMMLTRTHIKEAMNKNEIFIQNYDEKCFDPISYRLRAGRIIGKSDSKSVVRKEIKSFREKGKILLEPNTYVWIYSYEKIRLGGSIFGDLEPTSDLVTKGLNLISGGKIHPSYDGYIECGIKNCLHKNVYLNHKEIIGRITFYRITGEEILRERYPDDELHKFIERGLDEKLKEGKYGG